MFTVGCASLCLFCAHPPSFSLHTVFRDTKFFNGDVGNWDVSSVASMYQSKCSPSAARLFAFFVLTRLLFSLNTVFEDASNFNQAIGDWAKNLGKRKVFERLPGKWRGSAPLATGRAGAREG